MFARLSIGAAACAFALAAGPALAATSVNVILNWVPAGAHSPLYYAEAQGWFDEAGLDVTIEQGAGSSVAAQKVGAGASEFGIADIPAAMVVRAKDGELKAVMNVFAKPPYGIYWLKDSGISGIEDFPGKEIGTPAGDAIRAVWPAIARKNGIDPDSVTWVNIAPNAKVSALRSGAVDITTFFVNYHYIMEGAFGDELVRTDLGALGLSPYSNSIFVNEDFLADNPQAVEDFVGVAQRAYRHCVDHAEACIDALIEANTGIKAENEIKNWRAVTELMTAPSSTEVALGYFDPARMAEDYELAKEFYDLGGPIEIEDFYTNAFLDRSVKMPE